MYSPGDFIVHPMHGAGKIREIVEQNVAGEMLRYYVLHIPAGNIRVMIPVNACEGIGIRPVVDRECAGRVVSAFAEIEEEAVVNWNRRYRENIQRIKSGQLDEVSRVVKSLMLREAAHGLSTGERKMLGTAKQILLSELSLAMDESFETLENRLRGSL